MHPFSIDYITRASEMTIPCDQPEGDSADNSRLTPSPSDSGVGSDNWPEKDETKPENDRDSVAQALLNLDRKAQKVSGQEVSKEKPAHSYIALISMAILSSQDKKMLLCDIYQYIMDNFTYYNNQDKAWRNSIRHNLSLNECFIKNGRADNGKGNFWSIHPACVKDFSKGDFRRRQARRRARKSTQEPSSSSLSMPYRYKVGYVPMTASHISFNPYSTGSPSFYYPQATVASLPSGAHGQTSPSSLSLYPKPSCPSSFYGRGDVSPPEYYSGTSTVNSSQSPFATISASSVQRYFAEETRLAIATQGLAQQHMQTPLQFQNW